MLPWSTDMKGRLERLTLDSALLRDNALGDPHERPLWVYLPPGYDDAPRARYPVIYQLQGFTGQVDMWANRSAFRRSFLELLDELFASGGAPPCIVAFPDCWTSLGGSQFLDSPATGRYHSYLTDEVVPFVDARFRSLAAREHRAVAGKSSGGYGAMVTAMLRPELFGGLATHAGDALFEVCYEPDFRECVRALRDGYGGSFERFFADHRARPALSKPSDHVLMNVWGMAACYSADPDGRVRLPFDPDTGRMKLDVWERWLERDPVRMAPLHAEALRSMRAVYIDAGRRDQWFLELGAEAFRRECAAASAPDVCFELFEGTHSGIEYRYPLAVKYLAERLKG